MRDGQRDRERFVRCGPMGSFRQSGEKKRKGGRGARQNEGCPASLKRRNLAASGFGRLFLFVHLLATTLHRTLEVRDSFSKTTADLGKTTRSKQNDHDHENDDEFGNTNSTNQEHLPTSEAHDTPSSSGVSNRTALPGSWEPGLRPLSRPDYRGGNRGGSEFQNPEEAPVQASINDNAPTGTSV